MFRTGPQLMFLTLIVGVLLVRESDRKPLNAANERFIDFLAENARRSEKAAPVTLIGLDEASLRERPLPWSPGDYALFFNAANNFHPQLVATDEILDWKLESLSPETSQTFAQYSQMLRENIRKSPRTVLGAELSFPDDADRIPPLESIAGLRNVKGDVSFIPEFRVIESQASEELRLASVQGFTTWPAARSSTRTAPLLLRYCGQIVPSLVLQTAMLWEEVTPDDVEVEVGDHIRLGGRVTIPIDAAGRMRVNITLPIGRCSVDDLLVKAEQKDAKTRTASRADVFSSRALFLSRTDSNAHLIPVAFDRARPRGELAALALGTIQNRLFIRSVPWWTNLAIIALFTLAAGFVPGLKRGHVFILGSVAILASLVSALALIGATLIAFPAIIPVGLTLFLVIARFLTPNRAMKTSAPPTSATPSTSAAPSTSPIAASTTTSPPPAIPVRQTEAAAPQNSAMN
jgi:hypothetical protein